MEINDDAAFIIRTEMGLNFDKRWNMMSYRQRKRFGIVMKDKWCI